jgi:DMSO/TMAO reductase YedYZ molybdopterin-dependent catalytic subunit
VIDGTARRLPIGGLVDRPTTLSLADLRSDRAVRWSSRSSVQATPAWGSSSVVSGTPDAAGRRWHRCSKPTRRLAVDVVFWGTDAGPVDVTGGWSGAPGTLMHLTETFARSMSLEEAMDPDNILLRDERCRPAEHGAPVRLIAPGWYGVANVKWLARIELTDHRYAGRFMARDYVTIREEARDGETVWTFATVRHDRLKSAPARVTRRGNHYTIAGAAWGAPISRVDVRIDNGPWTRADLSGRFNGNDFAWRFWTLDWPAPAPGQHTVTSRAYDTHGNVQPAPTDAFLAAKRTYWESNGQITRKVTIA